MENVIAVRNEIKVNGNMEFMGIEIPVVSGGFGADKRAMTDKMIGEIHETRAIHIRELINKNRNRFKNGVDIIDLKSIGDVDTLLKLGYSKSSIAQAQNMYLLSERGYSKIIKIMDSDKAWEAHDFLVDSYFTMREQLKKTLSPAEILMQQAQFMMEQERVNNELKQEIQVLKLDNQQILSEQKEIKEVVARSTSLREGDMTAEAIAREFLIFSSNSGRPHGSFANLLAMELGIYLPPEGNIGYRDEYISVGTKQRNGVDVATVKYSEKARDLMKDSIENEGLRFGNPVYWKKGEKKGLFNKCQITFDGGNIWVNETTYKVYNGDFE